MEYSTKVFIALGAIALIIMGITFYSRSPSESEPGKYDEFAKCLSDSGAKMFGAYWCPHCQNQKKLFGSSADKIPYIECDPRGNDANPSLCEENNINGYPTWIFGNGERKEGEVTLQELSFRSGCTLPQ